LVKELIEFLRARDAGQVTELSGLEENITFSLPQALRRA
jgi:hypothetical protein